MINNYIEEIVAEDYEDNTYIYIPYDNKTIRYSIVLSEGLNFPISSYSVCFLDSKNGFKYQLNTLDYCSTNDRFIFEFEVDKQSSEMANIDFIDLFIETYKSSFSLKKEVKIKYLKTANKSLTYSIGKMKILDSNLLSIRNKIVSPSWGTVNKNTVSNSTKLLDQLHNTFSSSYSKVNEYTRMSYDPTYQPLIFDRLFLTQKPRTVLRNIDDCYREELKETTDINSSLYALDIKQVGEDLKISTVILDP